MVDPYHIRITDYDYDLPSQSVAVYPMPERDRSKLLVYNHGQISEDVFGSLPGYIHEDSLMVFNNTKVIQARLRFVKATGALIEVFCLEPYRPTGYELSLGQTRSVEWICMVGNLKKWKNGPLKRTLNHDDTTITLTASILGSHDGDKVVRFEWDHPGLTFAGVLELFGKLPIPPYLNRESTERDKETYQTVYSKVKGSVAAPTAGLHFTPRVLDELRQKKVDFGELTLHVGAGTFKPVKSEFIGNHVMHTEYISVNKGLLLTLIRHHGGALAVGTTSVRTLESLYYIGSMLALNPRAEEEDLRVTQWQPYQTPCLLSPVEALRHIVDYLERHHLNTLRAKTSLMIVPGYSFKIVRAMITNFHLPQSTLLLLVSAFVNGKWREIYDYALTHSFRFLSYGDASLLIP